SAAAPPGARAVGAEPEPDPEPPVEPAPAAAAAPFPCTPAPLSPGFPTLTSTFTFFGLSWFALADAFAFPACYEFPGGSPFPGALAELPGELVWPVALPFGELLLLPLLCAFAAVVTGGA